MNETLSTVDGRSVLRMERRLAHPPEKVWRAVTDPAELRQWFPAEMEMDFRVGGKITFVFAGDEAPPTNGVITELDPPRVFGYSWDRSELRWELQADGDGCLLVFTQVFDDRAGAASFAAGWVGCLDVLEQILDGRPPEPPGRMVAEHEAFVATFGLDEGVAETTPDGWRVRFERQLVQPAEVAWATLTGPADNLAVGEAVPDAATVPEFRAGAVTAVQRPSLLEYEWLADGTAAGLVRWELGEGTGHGARLVLVQTGPAALADAQSTALAAWRARIEQLAAQLAAAPPPNAPE